MNPPSLWEVKFIGHSTNSAQYKEWPNEPFLKLVNRCILKQKMLGTEKHLIAIMKHLLSAPLISLYLLSLSSLMNILHSPLKSLLHSRHKHVDTLNSGGATIPNKVQGCTRLIPIVEIK